MRTVRLCALATDATCQLDVLGHDGHALGVDGAQVGVLEQAHQVGLGGLLQRQHRLGLEAQVGLQQRQHVARLVWLLINSLTGRLHAIGHSHIGENPSTLAKVIHTSA